MITHTLHLQSHADRTRVSHSISKIVLRLFHDATPNGETRIPYLYICILDTYRTEATFCSTHTPIHTMHNVHPWRLSTHTCTSLLAHSQIQTFTLPCRDSHTHLLCLDFPLGIQITAQRKWSMKEVVRMCSSPLASTSTPGESVRAS